MLVLLFSLTAIAAEASIINNFIVDCIQTFDLKRVAIVTEDCNELTNHLCLVSNGTAQVSFHCLGDDEFSLQHLLDHEAEDIPDVIITDWSKRHLYSPVASSRNKSIAWYLIGSELTESEVLTMNLRLDSNILLANQVGSELRLKEAYAIKNQQGCIKEVGKWNWREGFTGLINSPIWDRRSNLQGVRLVSTILANKNMAEFETHPNGSIIFHPRGYFIDIFDSLAAVLNFSVSYIKSRDGEWGTLGPDGATWNGMVAMLMDGAADVTTTSFSYSLERSFAIDLSVALEPDIDTLHMRAPKGVSLNYQAYFSIVSPASWLAIFVAVTAIAVNIFLAHYFNLEAFHSQSDPEPFGISNAFIFVSLSIVQRVYPIFTLKKASSRCHLIVLYVFGFLIFSHYTAVLTSWMTTGPAPVDIRSFQDAYDNADKLSFIVEEGSNERAMINSNPNSPLHKIYYEKIQGRREAYVKGLTEPGEELRKDGSKVYFGSLASMAMEKDIISLPLIDALHGHYAFGLQPNSEFLSLFNHHLIQMEQSGILNKLRTKWFKKIPDEKNSGDEGAVLGYENVLFPFLVVGLGTAVSLVVVALEVFHGR